MSKVAVVTGANKGIGLAIVRALCKQFSGVVYLTARDVKLGQAAVEILNQEGLQPKFHQLDIDNIESINKFAEYIKEKYGGLDVLVNNAAIAYKKDDNITPLEIQAEHTLRINYFCTLNLCNALFPLLRSHARVVNVSSRAGLLKLVENEEIRKRLKDENTTIDDVTEIMRQYLHAVKENKHQSLGFPNNSYGMSKVGLTAITFVQQRAFDFDTTRNDIVVNSCSPGYVATAMTSFKGVLTVEQGAETPVALALLPENVIEPRGQFVFEKKIYDWANAEINFYNLYNSFN